MSDHIFDDDETAARLGASLAPVEPSARVRDALLAAIEEVEQERRTVAPEEAAAEDGPGAGPRLVRMAAPTAAGAGSEAGSGSGVAAETGADSGSGSRGGAHGKAPARDRRVIPMFARVLAAAAAAVALFAAGIGVGRWTTMTSMESTSHYAALNQAQDVRRSTDTMPDGHVVTLTWSPEMGMTAITTPSALRAPEGQVMQVWARHGNTVESLGVYERRGGDYSFVDIMPQPGSEIFLTFEPQGGSAQPTGEPLVVLRVGAPDPA